MAKKAALGVLEFGDTPTAIGELREWNTTGEPAEIDTTVMGSGNARFQPGAIRKQVECSLFFEDPDDAGQALIRAQLGNDTPQTVSVYPFGKTTGKAVLSGKAFVMRENSSGAADGAVEMEALFSSDENGLTWSTVP